jgi:hypothetical protein
MLKGGLQSLLRRRKELVLLLAALAVGGWMTGSALSGWLEREHWGSPIVTSPVGKPEPVPPVDVPDLAAAWREEGASLFGGTGAVLRSGGKAKLPLPPPPPLRALRPPAPMVRPMDLLREGIQ